MKHVGKVSKLKYWDQEKKQQKKEKWLGGIKLGKEIYKKEKKNHSTLSLIVLEKGGRYVSEIKKNRFYKKEHFETKTKMLKIKVLQKL